jgi:3-dehydroquinate synthase II
MGDRACVDTAALLLPGEGMLLGSFAGGFFLVLSEALESGYIAARPFRVNAGAVCNYSLQGERTAYLSELAAGKSVVLTDAQGRTREEVVGRVKVERRPLILLEAEAPGGARFSVLLQNAETVRVATPSGSASVSELRVGDAVLLALASTAARHSGIAVLEQCCEK